MPALGKEGEKDGMRKAMCPIHLLFMFYIISTCFQEKLIVDNSGCFAETGVNNLLHAHNPVIWWTSSITPTQK